MSLAVVGLVGLALAFVVAVRPGLVPAPFADWFGRGVPGPAQLGMPDPRASFTERSHVRIEGSVGDRSGQPYTGEVWIELAQERELGRATASGPAQVVSGVLDVRLEAFRVDASRPLDVAVWRGSRGASRTSVFASDADGHAFFRTSPSALRDGVHVLALGRCVLAAPPLLATVALSTDEPSNEGHLVLLPRSAAADEVASIGARVDVAPGSTHRLYSFATSDVWSVIGSAGGVRSDVVEFARGSEARVHVARHATLAGTLDTQAFPGRHLLVFFEAEEWTPCAPTREVGMPRYWEVRRRALGQPQGQAFEDGRFQSGRLVPHTRYVVELWNTAAMRAGAPVHTTSLATNGGDTTDVHIAAP